MPRVVRSTIIDAPIEAVWAALRDFNAHDQWHPAVGESHVEGGRAPDEIGCVRNFRLQNGAHIREQLLTLSDRDHTFTYCILDAPIPLNGYVATVTLKRVTDGNRTFWDWRSRFDAPRELAGALTRMVGEEVYDAGIEAIRALVSGHRGARTAGAARIATPVPRASLAPIPANAIVIARHGGAEELVMKRASAPAPGAGEVRLRQTAVGVNFIDVYVRNGFYPMLTPPGTPGMEAAGQVIDVGSGVVGILPGDRVAYACPPAGAYCDVRTIKADQLVVLPADIDDETAAALMLKGMSAEYLLTRTHRVERGETVLVHSAAGGVGLLLCQWAKHLGATVIGTVSSPEKARLARENGCDVPIVTAGRDFVADVMDATKGRGADVIYDGVGGDHVDRSFEVLATCGQLVSFGETSGAAKAFDAHRLSSKSATISRPVLFHYTAAPERLREMSANVFELVRRGVLRAPIHQRWPLAQAAEAHRALEARTTTGATLLLP
jgi:NADPH:quinone reductase-like Zn-dependent oxidoreductase